MDRAAALRIFGLDDRAGDSQLQEAFWRLRAHVEERLDEAESEGERSRCELELRGLDHALEAAARTPAEANRLRISTPPSDLRSKRTRAIAFGFVAGLVALFAVYGWAAGGVEGLFRGDPPSEVETVAVAAIPDVADTPPEFARIAVQPNLPDTYLEVVDAETGELAFEGDATGEMLELAAGRYAFRVEHAECSDVWTREIVLTAGSEREVLSRSCQKQGWLTVRSNVSRDRLLIDGEPIGSTGPRQHLLEAGEHQIQVSKLGYLPWEGAVDVPAATAITLRASLVPKPRESEPGQGDAGAPTPPSFTGGANESANAGGAGDGGTGGGGGGGDLRAGDGGSLEPVMSPVEYERTHEWHRSAKRYLLTRYDRDLSGSLDTASEIAEIPCEDWLNLEGSFKQAGLKLSLTRFYGFDGTKWVDGAFGISSGMRGAAYQRMTECGLE